MRQSAHDEYMKVVRDTRRSSPPERVIKVTEWVCDKVSMPPNGGTNCRFMRPRALVPPTVQLGNSGIDPPAQVPQRDIIDAQMAFFGTGCIINEQVILQDQEGLAA